MVRSYNKLRPAENPTLERFYRKVTRPELRVDPPPGVQWPTTENGTQICPPGEQCWLWHGSYSNGRPMFMGHQGMTTAKRWAALYLSPRSGMANPDVDFTPPDARVESICGHPVCVNPRHHRVMSQEEYEKRRIDQLQRRYGLLSRGMETPLVRNTQPKATGVASMSEAERADLLQRITAKSVPDGKGNPCHIWIGGTNGKFRPMMQLLGKQVSVARVLMELQGHGPEKIIRRRCRERLCVNPEHLVASEPFDVSAYSKKAMMADTEQALARGRARADGGMADEEGKGRGLGAGSSDARESLGGGDPGPDETGEGGAGTPGGSAGGAGEQGPVRQGPAHGEAPGGGTAPEERRAVGPGAGSPGAVGEGPGGDCQKGPESAVGAVSGPASGGAVEGAVADGARAGGQDGEVSTTLSDGTADLPVF